MTFLLMYLVFHLTVGTFAARYRYAHEVHAAGTRDIGKLIKRKEAEIKAVRHAPNCWRGSRHRSVTEDCDCENAGRWKQLNRELRSLEAGTYEISSPYSMLFFWPLLGYHAFLTGGKVKATPALRPKEWEQQMEKELLELES